MSTGKGLQKHLRSQRSLAQLPPLQVLRLHNAPSLQPIHPPQLLLLLPEERLLLYSESNRVQSVEGSGVVGRELVPSLAVPHMELWARLGCVRLGGRGRAVWVREAVGWLTLQ